MGFLVLFSFSQPPISGRLQSASSRESSDSKYASLLALLGALSEFLTGKNLLFVGDAFFSSDSSHRRAFLGGRLGGSDRGVTADELAEVELDSVCCGATGLLDILESRFDIGSVRRRCNRGEVCTGAEL